AAAALEAAAPAKSASISCRRCSTEAGLAPMATSWALPPQTKPARLLCATRSRAELGRSLPGRTFLRRKCFTRRRWRSGRKMRRCTGLLVCLVEIASTASTAG
ncbi:unnamed protein product, partial [Ectocarpus sp. 12 AP-2014]